MISVKAAQGTRGGPGRVKSCREDRDGMAKLLYLYCRVDDESFCSTNAQVEVHKRNGAWCLLLAGRHAGLPDAT
jgi:hypothetical protein